jgi:hypothetical protein
MINYYRNGEATEYGGGRAADAIVSWILKKAESLSTDLTRGDPILRTGNPLSVEFGPGRYQKVCVFFVIVVYPDFFNLVL